MTSGDECCERTLRFRSGWGEVGDGVPPIGGALSAFLPIPDKEIADSNMLSAGGPR